MSIQSTGLGDEERHFGAGHKLQQRAPDPITVTVTETRRLSGLSNTTVYKLIGEGKLSVIKIGARTLVTFASLRKLLEVGTTS
jgi:excisionase family DNA binding protein